MYTKSFFITDPVSNNAFSFEKRQLHSEGVQKLFVPSVVKGRFSDLEEGSEVVFQEFDDAGVLRTCSGLKHFICTEWNSIPVVIFDNHNHAFYFWHEARKAALISDGIALIHIDQHSDMREPTEYFSEADSHDLPKLFDYTNTVLNVGNFIIPAQKTGLIGEIIQINGEMALLDFISRFSSFDTPFLLDLDMDFFETIGCSDALQQEAKMHIRNMAKRAIFITSATSPFFTSQARAFQSLRDLFTDRLPLVSSEQ